MQQDQPAEGIATVIQGVLRDLIGLGIQLWVEHLKAHRVAQRGEVAGWADITDADARTHGGVGHGVHGFVEVLRDFLGLICTLAHKVSTYR